MMEQKNNCQYCNSPINLQDLKNRRWVNDSEEFYFECSFCRKENKLVFPLFINEHIAKHYIRVIKEDSNYLLDGQKALINQHLEICAVCRNKFDEQILGEIESKITFNEESLRFFETNSQEVVRQLQLNDVKFIGKDDEINIEGFAIDDSKFVLTKEDEFYRRKRKFQHHDGRELDYLNIFYYLRDELCLSGMVSFLILDDIFIVDRIWLRPKQVLEKEKKFFEDLKNGKVKIKLNTLANIFKRLS